MSGLGNFDHSNQEVNSKPFNSARLKQPQRWQGSESPVKRRFSIKFGSSKNCTEECLKDVLLVDDEPMNLFALEGLARFMKFNPVACSSGVEALRVYQKMFLKTCCTRKFNLVISDL